MFDGGGVPTPNHPADTNSDWRIPLGEYIPYGACYKNPASCTKTVTLAYHINAAAIYKGGETYHYVSATPPACWVSG